MATVFRLKETDSGLVQLIALLERGEEVIIERGAKQVALVTSVRGDSDQQARRRGYGRFRGQFEAPPEAFAPLTDEELKDWGY